MAGKSEDVKKCRGRGTHEASHPRWRLRREAFVWDEGRPIKPNMRPMAHELMLWLAHKVHSLEIFTAETAKRSDPIGNPYTYCASTLRVAYADALNEAYQFANSADPIDCNDAEIRRIRFQSEVVLLAARFCEAAIKQMLHCTDFPEGAYQNAALGSLLAMPCRYCKKPNGHDVSLVGALAHRYFLCWHFINCAFDHFSLVSRRRNQEAAHSSAQTLNPRTPKESRADLDKTLDAIGHEFGHLCHHIGEVELALIRELEAVVEAFPDRPSRIRLNIRWPDDYYPELRAAYSLRRIGRE